MSIQSEIDRINQAKADILAALTDKGVDTTGAGLSDIAALVAGIEAGGAKVAHGTFTLAESIALESGSGIQTGYYLTHNCGFVPSAFVYYAKKGNNLGVYMGVGGVIAKSLYDDGMSRGIQIGIGTDSTSGAMYATSMSGIAVDSYIEGHLTETKAPLLYGKYKNKVTFPAGEIYYWLAIG